MCRPPVLLRPPPEEGDVVTLVCPVADLLVGATAVVRWVFEGGHAFDVELQVDGRNTGRFFVVTGHEIGLDREPA